MKTHMRKIGRGQPRYDGLGAAMSAVGLHADDLHTARAADAALLPDGWGLGYLNQPFRPSPAAPNDDTTTSAAATSATDPPALMP